MNKKKNLSVRRVNDEVDRHPGRRRRLTIWLFVCMLFFTWTGIQWFHQMGQISDKRAELKRSTQQLSEAEAEKRELQIEIEHLHDPEYIAELARKEYYMTKKGEIIFVDPRHSH